MVRPQNFRHMQQFSGINWMGLGFSYIQIPWEGFIIPFYHFEHRKQDGVLMRTVSLIRCIVFNETIVSDASIVFFDERIKRIIQ